MKPLILWARDKHPTPYLLRITAKTGSAVIGDVKIDNHWLPFRFERAGLVITIGEGDGERRIHINEWGWEQ